MSQEIETETQYYVYTNISEFVIFDLDCFHINEEYQDDDLFKYKVKVMLKFQSIMKF